MFALGLIVMMVCVANYVVADDISEEFGDATYTLLTTKRNYYESQAACEELGMNLVTVDDEQEHEFVIGLLRGQSRSKDIWVGEMYQQLNAGGSESSESSDSSDDSMEKRGKPMKCVAMKKSARGQRRDIKCDKKLWAMCEKEKSGLTCSYWTAPTWNGPIPTVCFDFEENIDFTMTSGVQHVNTPYGKGLRLTQSNDYVTLTELQGISCAKTLGDCEEGFTVTALVKSFERVGYILGTEVNDLDQQQGFFWWTWIAHNQMTLVMNVATATSIKDVITAPFPIDSWIRLTLVQEPNLDLRGYIDDTEIEWDGRHNSIYGAALSSGKLALGSAGDFAGLFGETADVIVEDVVIFDKALTAEQIRAMPKAKQE